jgi:hypothetical protein
LRLHLCFGCDVGCYCYCYYVDATEKECVQGMVSLFDQTESTGGLVVVPDSHHLFTAITERHASRARGHLVRLTGGWDDELLADTRPIIVGCKAGDLILWDSRTVHCNSPALLKPNVPAEGEVDLLRAVAYVCMVPRSKADRDVLRHRSQAVAGRITTSHWPQFFLPNHPKMSSDPPRLTPEQRALV